MDDDRRRVQRLNLPERLPGWLGAFKIELLEIGLFGAQVEHLGAAAPETISSLTFRWGGEELSFESRVVRCQVQPQLATDESPKLYRSGLEFQESENNSSAALRAMITAHVTRGLEEQKANAKGNVSSVWVEKIPFLSCSPDSSEDREVSRPQVYLRCELARRGIWKKSLSGKPNQPSEGFTVRSDAAGEDLEMLCNAYDNGDEATRKLIRSCAEISLTEETDVIPPQRFNL